MKQTRKMLLLLALLIPAGAMAQDNEQAIQMSRPAKVQRMTYEQMTEKMVSELQLDEKQAKMVTKLNKKYKTLIEGQQMERPLGQRPQNGNHPTGRPSGGGGMSGGMGGRGGGFGGGRPGGPGSRNTNITYKGATELKTGSTEDSHTYQSSKTDENALLISTKEAVALSQPTISKTGSSDGGDNCSFYGVNAAMLVKGGSVTTIKGGKITSNATGANGVFSYGGNGGRNGGQGDGTTVIIEDTEIITTGDGSGGIMTTGGGVTKAKNLSVCTSGRSSAPIRTDRGGGIVTIEAAATPATDLAPPLSIPQPM